jgi:glycosyltransferase 2 family protein
MTSQSSSFSVGRFVRLNRRSALSFAPAILATGGGIYLALRGVDLDGVTHALASSDYRTLAPAFVLLAIATYVRVVRWRLLFGPSTRPALRPAVEATLIGQFFNNVLPLRAGEALRVLALHARAGTSRAETLATVVVERAFDVLALLMLLFVTLAWLPAISWLRAAAVLALGASLAIVGIILLLARYGTRPVRFLALPLARLPFLSLKRVEHGAESLVRGLAALRHARLGLVSFGLTLTSWVLLAASFWLVAIGFVSGLSPLAGVLIAVAIGLALILPSGPAALGVFEAAVVSALAAYGVPRSDALSAALVLHAVNFFPFLAAGGVVLLARGGTGWLGGGRGFAADGPEREAERQSEAVDPAQERHKPVVGGEGRARNLRAAEDAARHEPAERADRVHMPNVLDDEAAALEEPGESSLSITSLMADVPVHRAEEGRMRGDEEK